MKTNLILRSLGAAIIALTTQYSAAQNDCGSAITVTDLTGTTCATSAPSTTNFVGSGSCEEGTNDTWFQFTAQGTSADFTVSSTANNWNPEYLIVSGTPASTCAGFGQVDCADANGNYTGITGTTTGLTVGETYWIVVSSGGNSSAGTISVCVDNPTAPAGCTDNEDCASPATLSLNAVGGAAACVTDCNTGASAGPDFAGNNCYDLPNETVWYSFTTDATMDNVDIGLTSGDMSDPEFTVFTTADCINYTIVDCVEGSGGSASSTALSLAPSTTYLIAVSDATGDVGDFDLCITQNSTPVSGCTTNEDCVDATTITLNGIGGGQECIVDCNTLASPGLLFTGNPCQNMTNETVWFSFTTDALTALLDIDLTSGDLSNPEFALFLDNGCTGAWTTVACNEGAGGTASSTSIPVAANTTYLLAVSDDGGDVGNFSLCIEEFEDNSACNVDNTLEVTATSMGSPMSGPFLPGEVVTFCYTIDSYLTSTTNCNYLQGIVPTFGDCWDPVSFNAQGMPVNITNPLNTVGTQNYSGGPPPPCDGDPAGTWSWYPAGTVDYNLNTSNPLGYSAGDDVGAGWFFVTNYDSYDIENGNGLDCTNDNFDPDDNYGDNSFPACSDLGGWSVCFQLQVKPIIACTTGETNCEVSVKTFADGEIGVWQNIGCTADGLTTQPGTINCTLPIELNDFTARYDGTANIVEWETITEQNTDYFILSHASSNAKIHQIATIPAAGNSQESIAYRYVHSQPHPGINYYNLKAVDLDGTVKDHGYAAVESDFNYAYFDASQQAIIISYPSNVEIYTMDGKLIKQSNGTTTIDFDENGIFILRDLSTGIVQRIVTN